MDQRRGGIAGLVLDRGELAIEEGALRRRGDRGEVTAARVVELAGVGRLARILDVLLDAAELQHVDAPAQRRQAGIGRERRLEGLGRGIGTAERQERLPFAGERRRIGRILRQRLVEVRQRRGGVLPRERRIAEPRFGGIERRDLLQNCGVKPLGRFPRRLTGGTTRPMLLDDDWRRQAVGGGRKHEVGKPGRARRHRHVDGLLRAPGHQHEHESDRDPASLAPGGGWLTARQGPPLCGIARAAAWAARPRR